MHPSTIIDAAIASTNIAAAASVAMTRAYNSGRMLSAAITETGPSAASLEASLLCGRPAGTGDREHRVEIDGLARSGWHGRR